MTKFCRNCGKPLPDEARFCNGCGTKLVEDGINQALGNNSANLNSRNIVNTVDALPRLEPVPKQDNKNMYIIAGVTAFFLLAGGGWFYMNSKNSPAKNTVAKMVVQQNTASSTVTKTEKVKAEKKTENAKPTYNAQKYVPIMEDYERRLSDLAGKINGEKETKDKLVSLGNQLRDDILRQRELSEQDRGSSGDVLQDVNYLMGLQQSRAGCMVAGIKGNTEAFAEGGGYYDEFQKAFASFKKQRNYKP